MAVPVHQPGTVVAHVIHAPTQDPHSELLSRSICIQESSSSAPAPDEVDGEEPPEAPRTRGPEAAPPSSTGSAEPERTREPADSQQVRAQLRSCL